MTINLTEKDIFQEGDLLNLGKVTFVYDVNGWWRSGGDYNSFSPDQLADFLSKGATITREVTLTIEDCFRKEPPPFKQRQKYWGFDSLGEVRFNTWDGLPFEIAMWHTHMLDVSEEALLANKHKVEFLMGLKDGNKDDN